MESTIIVAVIGAVATITAALITARAKDLSYAEIIRGQRIARSRMLHSSKYGLEIVTPSEYDQVNTSFDVSGTYKNLPEDQEIWISTFRISTDSKGNRVRYYWPQEKAITKNGKWYSKVNNIGSGQSGESKEFLVLVVGGEGQALFKYFKETGSENKNWPAIKQLTSDVVECVVSKVRLK